MGGWDSLATQKTVITPDVVKRTMDVLHRFVDEFNTYTAQQSILPIQLGPPTGSSAWFEVDDADKIYGDVDVQIIVPAIAELEDKTNSATQAYWNELTNTFITTITPDYVHSDSSPGHPIINVGNNDWVQVDFMYHTADIATWGRYRVTPERGLKGSLHGNMFSVLGDLLQMSIQHNGVQLKLCNGERVSFNKRKGTELKTITTDVNTFVKDIFDYEYTNITGNDPATATVDELLVNNPGVDITDIRVSGLVDAVKGLARSFELNDMYSKGSLSNYSNSVEYIDAFWNRYEEKAMLDINSKKRNKAQTANAKLRAQQDCYKIVTGLAIVRELFQ